jgi:hypothetical protein
VRRSPVSGADSCVYLRFQVFGSVTRGLEVVKACEAVGSRSGATRQPVVIADCGQIS